jgi:hypothetical protein
MPVEEGLGDYALIEALEAAKAYPLPTCATVDLSLADPLQVEDEEGKTRLLIQLTIEEQNEHRWCLWRPDHAGFDSSKFFFSSMVASARLEKGRAKIPGG